MAWQPDDYLTFAKARTRPAQDLLARVVHPDPRRVVDLGCGPGNATALLAERWPDAAIAGVDSSPEMLAKARASGIRASWCQADIQAWASEAAGDVLFSNAALHWLPDHASLFPRLFGFLAAGGVLAVQMPLNSAAPSHALIREVAEAEAPAALPALAHGPEVLAPDAYVDLLAPLGGALDLWATTYLHILEGEDPVLRWVRSTTLRPIREALCDHAYARFERTYAERLRQAYPRRADGRTLFPFQRLFLVAIRPTS